MSGPATASRVPMRSSMRPARYIAGEESAAVHFVNEGDARPTPTPPRPFERGVDGRPTLVQNVESLAYAALIARAATTGTGRRPAETRGHGPLTVSGASAAGRPRDRAGTTVARSPRWPASDRSRPACCSAATSAAGSTAAEAWNLPLDPAELRQVGRPSAAASSRSLPPTRAACGDRPDHRLHGRFQRRPVRPVRLRATGDRRRHWRPRARHGHVRRPRPHRALDAAARRPRRLPPSGWGGGPVGQRAAVFGAEFVRHAAGRGCSIAGGRGAAA